MPEGYIHDDAISPAPNLELVPNMEILQDGIDYLSAVDLEKAYLAKRERELEAPELGLLTFRGEKIQGLTCYNTTTPFLDGSFDPETGKPYFILGVRTEPPELEKELESTVQYFRASDPYSSIWDHVDSVLPTISGQDPAVSMIAGNLLVNVVEVKWVPATPVIPSHAEWRTAFYHGTSIQNLELHSYGPIGMKDITPVELPVRGKVLTFTRPQHRDPELGGRGQIGSVVTDSIESYHDPATLAQAELINTRFLEEEWGGIKWGVALQPEKVGVIGHIARFDTFNPEFADNAEKPKVYSTFSAIYDTETRKLEDVEIIAMADEFVGVTPKTPYLKHVAFGTGITEPDSKGNVRLFLGIGDASTGYKTIKDPFVKWRWHAESVIGAA